MKQLELSAEKAVEREEKLKDKILNIQMKFKASEGRYNLLTIIYLSRYLIAISYLSFYISQFYKISYFIGIVIQILSIFLDTLSYLSIICLSRYLSAKYFFLAIFNLNIKIPFSYLLFNFLGIVSYLLSLKKT